MISNFIKKDNRSIQWYSRLSSGYHTTSIAFINSEQQKHYFALTLINDNIKIDLAKLIIAINNSQKIELTLGPKDQQTSWFYRNNILKIVIDYSMGKEKIIFDFDDISLLLIMLNKILTK